MGASSGDRIFLYYPSRRQMRPALKALVDFLRDERRGASQGASQ
jgi:DNA-binding transcriptional LysR family regulator